MNALHHLQEKIVEELNDLYEAFYVAQAEIEENDIGNARLRSESFIAVSPTLAGCERDAS